jgi:pyruvate kinase
MRRTKIVATLGPATRSPEQLRALIAAGADVLRLNFAHATPDIHREAAEEARRQAAELGKVIGLLVDLPGPKMRTGTISGDEAEIQTGQPFVLKRSGAEGDHTGVTTTVDDLASKVEPGQTIYLADGEIVLEVTDVHAGDVHTKVLRGGTLRSRKGLHLPGLESSIDAFTEEDAKAMLFALEIGADLVGMSFVKSARDIENARTHLPKKGPCPSIVAKIETQSAVRNMLEIAREADVVMVARGDLGIQLPYKEVPLLQKEIIRTCNIAGKPVITATQMLESMTDSALPTRAEVNDVANAVMDGTDAVMLSEETAVGDYPIKSVQVMSEIAEAAEAVGRDRLATIDHEFSDKVSAAIARAAVVAAEDLHAAAIVCPTRSGATARRVAAFRPSMPILALGHKQETIQPLAVVWGVIPHLVPFLPEEELARQGIGRATAAAAEAGIAKKGDLLAIVAGGSAPRAGSADFVRIVAV